MVIKAGEGFVELFGHLNEAQVQREVTTKLGAAGRLAGSSFQNAFTGKLKAAGELIKGNPELFGAAIAIGGVFALKKVADATAAYAGEVRGLRETVGGTAEDSSRLVAVFHALGIETDTAQRPLLTLADNLHKGGGKLKDFFDAAEIARFRNQDLSKTLVDLGDKYKSIHDPIDRDAFVVAALTKRGLALRPVLAANREEIQKFAKDAQLQGLIFNDKQIADARSYQIAVRELGETFKGLEVRLGKEAIPEITNTLSAVNQGILKGEDLAGRFSRALDHLPGPLRALVNLNPLKKYNDTVLHVIFGTDKAKASTDSLHQSMDQIEESATSDEKAAKLLQAALKDAFDISDKAAQAFEKRLDALIPKLGETFQDVKIGSVDTSAEGQATAADKLKSAQDRLASAEDHLAKVRAQKKHTATDIAAAERGIASARDAVTKATDGVTKSHQNLADALEGTIRADAQRTSKFASDLTALNARFATIASRGGQAVEQSFLSHLSDLGPGAVALLDDLLRKSDGKLGELAGLFGDQIAAAKTAADLQFDKYPANFAEKVGAARKAATDQLAGLIAEFQALPDNADPGGAWASKMDDMARAIEVMAQQGLLPLTSVEKGFLDTALGADDAGTKAKNLQLLIDRLHGKTVPVNVKVDKTQLVDLDNALKGNPVYDVGIRPVLVPSSSPGPDPTKKHSLQDILEGKAAGGSVLAGRDYLVGERGPEILRMGSEGSGRIIPNEALAAAGTQTIVLELDGEVLARKTVRHNGRAAENYRRERA